MSLDNAIMTLYDIYYSLGQQSLSLYKSISVALLNMPESLCSFGVAWASPYRNMTIEDLTLIPVHYKASPVKHFRLHVANESLCSILSNYNYSPPDLSHNTKPSSLGSISLRPIGP